LNVITVKEFYKIFDLKIQRIYDYNDQPIIDEKEQQEIVEFIVNNLEFLDLNGINRYKQYLDFFESPPEIFNIVRQRIIEKEKLYNYRQEPTLRDSIGYMTNGSKLHIHTDPRTDGLEHVRFNVYVQLPKIGGRPIYAGIKHNLQERRYICCRSSLDLHHASNVKGNRARIIISYGFLIPLNEIGEIFYSYPK
jgi:hypothetical protein